MVPRKPTYHSHEGYVWCVCVCGGGGLLAYHHCSRRGRGKDKKKAGTTKARKATGGGKAKGRTTASKAEAADVSGMWSAGLPLSPACLILNA